jgi:hypothetical protein
MRTKSGSGPSTVDRFRIGRVSQSKKPKRETVFNACEMPVKKNKGVYNHSQCLMVSKLTKSFSVAESRRARAARKTASTASLPGVLMNERNES